MISGKTRVFGIFGYPVEHTFSPGMHNAAFGKLGLDACYVPYPVHPDRLSQAVKAVIPLGLSGLNITVPHKERIIAYLDHLTEEAGLIGAVNTVEVKNGELIGHNTDGRGFLRSLKEQANFAPRRKKILVIGAGGAARAVGFSLALAGASSVVFLNRNPAKAVSLARDIRTRTCCDARTISYSDLAQAAAEADCLINSTPLGSKKKDSLPVPVQVISSRHLVCDLVYNPHLTPLLKSARKRKAAILPGLGMLLFQGVIAFEIWTRKKAPVSVMKAALSRQIPRV
jgi:shikimate dehydrogenase